MFWEGEPWRSLVLQSDIYQLHNEEHCTHELAAPYLQVNPRTADTRHAVPDHSHNKKWS